MCKGGERGDVLWRRGGSSTEYSEPLDVLACRCRDHERVCITTVSATQRFLTSLSVARLRVDDV